MDVRTGFTEAMRADMATKEMSEAAVGKALGISQQAVHKWLERGFPPLSRVNDLREVLGVAGEFAKLDHEDLFGDGKTSRTPNPKNSAGSRGETLSLLFALLPADPALRAKVFAECARTISAALDTEPSGAQ